LQKFEETDAIFVDPNREKKLKDGNLKKIDRCCKVPEQPMDFDGLDEASHP
jgi:hypothetical protein